MFVGFCIINIYNAFDLQISIADLKMAEKAKPAECNY